MAIKKDDYLPDGRIYVGSNLDKTALNQIARKNIARTIEPYLIGKNNINTILDSISKLVARYPEGEEETRKYLSLKEQRETVNKLTRALKSIRKSMKKDRETKKRMYLHVGKPEQGDKAKYEKGKVRVERYLKNLEEAVNYARSRIHKLKSGPKKVPYLRRLVRGLAFIWIDETNLPFIVTTKKLPADKRDFEEKHRPRWFIETVLTQANFSFDHHDITSIMKSVKKDPERPPQMTDESDASDLDYEKDTS